MVQGRIINTLLMLYKLLFHILIWTLSKLFYFFQALIIGSCLITGCCCCFCCCCCCNFCFGKFKPNVPEDQQAANYTNLHVSIIRLKSVKMFLGNYMHGNSFGFLTTTMKVHKSMHCLALGGTCKHAIYLCMCLMTSHWYFTEKYFI